MKKTGILRFIRRSRPVVMKFLHGMKQALRIVFIRLDLPMKMHLENL